MVTGVADSVKIFHFAKMECAAEKKRNAFIILLYFMIPESRVYSCKPVNNDMCLFCCGSDTIVSLRYTEYCLKLSCIHCMLTLYYEMYYQISTAKF